jgi:hypothetical protein
MNVLIVDTDKIHLDLAAEICKQVADKTECDLLIIPKGIDIIQDISVDWMKMIRDTLDKKIKALESDVN